MTSQFSEKLAPLLDAIDRAGYLAGLDGEDLYRSLDILLDGFAAGYEDGASARASRGTEEVTLR